MKTMIAVAAVLAVSVAALPHSAYAVGCASGAAVGGVGGHMAGNHAVLGAAAGCAVGHHEAKKKAAAQAQPAQ